MIFFAGRRLALGCEVFPTRLLSVRRYKNTNLRTKQLTSPSSMMSSEVLGTSTDSCGSEAPGESAEWLLEEWGEDGASICLDFRDGVSDFTLARDLKSIRTMFKQYQDILFGLVRNRNTPLSLSETVVESLQRARDFLVPVHFSSST